MLLYIRRHGIGILENNTMINKNTIVYICKLI